MKNRELFVLDPTENVLLNNGVAEINTDKNDDNGQTIIKYELKTFVCEGEYQKGLFRILDTYLKHIDKPSQPAVWVSGFFGSGKSHLVKMLSYLWEDFEFKSGETARNIKQLPTDISDMLFELNKKQNNIGRLAISGTLKDFPSDDIRYSFFQFFLSGLGLPPKFHHFKFVHWLHQESIYDQLKDEINAEGRDFDKELANFYVSPFIAKGILKLKPDFAESEAKVREYLKANFVRVEKISRDDLINTIKDEVIPMFYDSFPSTLVVLDEVQQFIGTDGDKSIDVQNLSQDLSKNFDGKLLLVSTGQNALSETSFLQRLQDRYTVKVMLSDADVETVTRKTVLEKKPTAQKELKKIIEKASGEIARNLQNSAFAYQSSDEENLAADYPILPSVRKFWKKVLDVIDTAGTQGQLRSQLGIVDESVKAIADHTVGELIPGDFIFEQKQQQLLQNARLLNDTYNLITQKKAGNKDEQLQGRVLSIAFLLDQLPTDLPGGIPKSNKEVMADLLFSDLTKSSDDFRRDVSTAVDALVEQQLLMPLGDEYKMQTKAGQEWEKEYTAQLQKIIAQGDDKLQTERNLRITKVFEQYTKSIRLNQGDAAVPRETTIHTGNHRPSTDEKLNLWLRDGWMENDKLVLDEIRREGTEAALAYAFIKKTKDVDLKNEITKYLSAHSALETKGIPSDPEGQQARKSMETRKIKADEEINEVIVKVVAESKIFLAGGTEVTGDNTKHASEQALKQLMSRQFPDYSKGDSKSWPQALRAAQNKNPNPLEKIGFDKDLHTHPVASNILRYMANSSYSGKDLRNNFTKSPYGWPQDAVDATLIALVNAEYLSSSENPLPQGKIGVSTFKKESHTLTAGDKIKIRKLFQDIGINTSPGEEFKSSGIFLNQLKELGQKVGGEAPLPEPVNLQPINEIEFLDGNARLQVILSSIEELKTYQTEWVKLAQRSEERLLQWEQLRQLLEYADGKIAADIYEQKDAIIKGRMLLAENNPITTLCQTLSDDLKAQVKELKKSYNSNYDKRMDELQSNTYFSQLSPEQKNPILRANQLLAKPELKDYDTKGLINSLAKCNIEGWQTKMSALNSQFDAATAAAVRILEPKAESYSLPRKTLSTDTEIDAYTNQLATDLKYLLKKAKSIILK